MSFGRGFGRCCCACIFCSDYCANNSADCWTPCTGQYVAGIALVGGANGGTFPSCGTEETSCCYPSDLGCSTSSCPSQDTDIRSAGGIVPVSVDASGPYPTPIYADGDTSRSIPIALVWQIYQDGHTLNYTYDSVFKLIAFPDVCQSSEIDWGVCGYISLSQFMGKTSDGKWFIGVSGVMQSDGHYCSTGGTSATSDCTDACTIGGLVAMWGIHYYDANPSCADLEQSITLNIGTGPATVSPGDLPWNYWDNATFRYSLGDAWDVSQSYCVPPSSCMVYGTKYIDPDVTCPSDESDE